MALTKVTYVDNVTVIGAANLNAIQDEIIANGNNISSLQSGKVDKDGSKVLSTNDFTNENLSKLNGIEAQATRVLVDTTLSGTSTNAIQNKAVKDALDEQSQRIDNASGSVADVYTPQAYSIGDYVTHDNKLYRAIVDIPTAEVWDDTHWEEVNVADVVSELQEDTTEVNDIALSAYVTDTATGSIATFPDGADNVPIKNLSVAIEPVQDLHGYDNPWPAGGGKNLAECTAQSQTVNGVSYVVNSDGMVTANGTASDTSLLIYGNVNLKAGSYILNGLPSNGSNTTFSIQLLDVSVVKETLETAADMPFTVAEDVTYTVRLVVRSGYAASNLVFKPMIRLATETDATFAPYSNLCPISGHTECNVTRTGKNLFDEANADWVYDRYLDNNDTPVSAANYKYTRNYIFVEPNTAYTLQLNKTTDVGRAASVCEYDAFKNIVNRNVIINTTSSIGIKKGTFTTRSDTKFIRLNAPSGSDSYKGAYNFQLEVGSTATAYEPYQGTTYPITFPSGTTVYGGNITVNQDGSGSLVVDMEEITFDGSESWGVESSGNSRYFFTRLGEAGYVVSTSAGGKAVCNQYTIASISISGSSTGVGFSIANSTARRQAQCNCRPIDTANHTAETFKAMLAESPMQVCYTLATPITIPLTAKQVGVITSLYGVNNFWADTGDVDVTIRADTQMFISARDKAITQSIAPIENGTTASNAYAQGDYFFHNAKFCKALTAIASGATFTLNTNYAETTVAEELATILNV